MRFLGAIFVSRLLLGFFVERDALAGFVFHIDLLRCGSTPNTDTCSRRNSRNFCEFPNAQYIRAQRHIGVGPRAFPRARRSRQERWRHPRDSECHLEPAEGSATLTDAQAADLMAGKYCVNVHTAANPGGEIRGQVTK
jgi:hypothetical protein